MILKIYTTSQKFLKKSFLLSKPAFIWSKVQQKQYKCGTIFTI